MAANSKRGTSVEYNILEKLSVSPEFHRYLEIIQEGIDTARQHLKNGLAGPEDIRDHNVTVGIIVGLEKARDLVDNHLKELRDKLEEQGNKGKEDSTPME